MSDNPNDMSKCPVMSGPHGKTAAGSTANQHWWPEQVNVGILHQQNAEGNPMGADFDYREAFKKLDLDALREDLQTLMTDSQSWWPADYGHYGPLFIRMAWHSAGTYRVGDGRGGSGSGSQRFAPLNSWPDNGNLDKARRLLWPIKQKYGSKISWADLMILAGNCALESMGFTTAGFAGGREDIWQPEEDISWGPETTWLGDERYTGDRELQGNLGAVQMGLIYVNPEGPNGNPDPVASAHDIRETFARMAMNDEETVALVAGGHTFGKAHGVDNPDQFLGPEPEASPIEAQGLGWLNTRGAGHGADTITSGIEGAWTTHPTRWDHEYFEILFGYEWQLTRSGAGAHQWVPTDATAAQTVPDAHDKEKTHAPIMTTADLALRFDPAYEKISRRFLEQPEHFARVFADAWFKLTHRDMGPYCRGLGQLVPAEPALWQDPIPEPQHDLVSEEDLFSLQSLILSSGLSIAQMVSTAWAAASTFRGSDMRGGANGARIRLSPQKDWAANNPSQLASVLNTLQGVQKTFNDARPDNVRISLADLIVLTGNTGVEQAAKAAGTNITVPFKAGRTDASQEQTDIESMAFLEPHADAFRNYRAKGLAGSTADMMIDRSQLLTLTAPEMTVLIGGLRVLGTNTDNHGHGVLTDRPGTLSNDFFVNLLNMNIQWQQVSQHTYEGKDRSTDTLKFTATEADLVFGSNSILRAVAEVYATDEGAEKFTVDFVKAWNKVMNLDRFDLEY